MKVTYIYLNTYKIGDKHYLYIGSHTCDSALLDDKGLDPNYQGSSHIASHNNWTPTSIECLRIFNNSNGFVDKYKAERDYIISYAKRYGVSPLAFKIKSNKFTETYLKPNGLLINCHSNSSEALHTKESRHEALHTKISNGSLQKFQQSGIRAANTKESRHKAQLTRLSKGSLDTWNKSTHTVESHSKSVQTQILNGSFEKFQKAGQNSITSESRKKAHETRKHRNYSYKEWIDSAHTSESVRKAVESRDYKVIYIKGQITRCIKGIKPSINIVSVYKDNNLLCTGPVRTCCKIVGNSNWSCYINTKIKQGVTEVIHHGFTFKVLSHTNRDAIKPCS